MVLGSRLPLLLLLSLTGCIDIPEEVVMGVPDSDSTSSTDVPPTGGAGTTSITETSAGTMGATSSVTTGMTSSVDTTEGLSATETGMTSDPGTTGDPPPPECTMPSECDNNETCDAGGNCIAACSPWGTGSYDYCLTDLGTFDAPALCGAGQACLSIADPIQGAACSVQGCADACDCPGPAATGDATVTCADVTGGGVADCYLSCADGEICPDGMSCFAGNICLTPPAPLPMYGDCGSVDAPCLDGTCSTAFVPGQGTFSVCVTLCEGVGTGACDPAPPGGTMDCVGVISPPPGDDCHLACNNDGDCPMGMECIQALGRLCMWP